MTKNVLITGGAGFIGSRLARRFIDDGHAVTVLDNLSRQVHGSNPSSTSPLLAEMPPSIRLIQGSVTNRTAVQEAIEDAEVLVHLAAETGTGQSMYEIDRYVQVNVGGTGLLLDVIANSQHDIKRIVVASSRSIYGEGAYRTDEGRVVFPPHRRDSDMAAGNFDVRMPGEDGDLTLIPTPEWAELHPSSVYGITKQTQESLILTVSPTLGVEPVALRYQNVYGPGQSLTNPYTGILSIFSTLIREGKPINIFEDGKESRDFVYIDDVVEATYRATLSPAAAGKIINIGSGIATTVEEVVQALFDAFGTRVAATVTGNYRLGDIRHNVSDTAVMRDVLDYRTQVGFREGVERFVDWVNTVRLESGGYEDSLAEMASRSLLK